MAGKHKRGDKEGKHGRGINDVEQSSSLFSFELFELF